MREIELAVGNFGALKYFPSDPGARAAVIGMLRAMVSTQDQLDWLLDAMLDRVGEWPGTAELRAVFCTRFAPRDGIEAWSKLPGFTALDSEAAIALPARPRELAVPRGVGGLVKFQGKPS